MIENEIAIQNAEQKVLEDLQECLKENARQIESKRKQIEMIEEEKGKKLKEENFVQDKCDRGTLLLGK